MQKKGNTNSKTEKYIYTYTQIRTQKIQIHKQRSTDTPRQSQQGSGQKLLIANVLDGHACVQSEQSEQYIEHLINVKQHTTCDMAMTTSEWS